MIRERRTEFQWLAFSGFTLLAILFTYCSAAHHYFDISDEGLHTYFASMGSRAKAVQQYHYVLNALGSLSGNTLLTYRWLFLIMTVVGAAILSTCLSVFFGFFADRNYLKQLSLFNLICSIQLFSSWFMTASYQSTAAFAASLWGSGLLLILSYAGILTSALGLLLLFSAILLGAMAKISTGVALCLGALVFVPLFFRIIWKKSFGLAKSIALILTVLISGAAFAYILGDSTSFFLNTYAAKGTSGPHSLTMLLGRHLRDLTMACFFYLPLFFVGWLLLLRLTSACDSTATKQDKKWLIAGIALISGAMLTYTFAWFRPFPNWFYTMNLAGIPVAKVFNSMADHPPAKMIIFLVAFSIICIWKTRQINAGSRIRKYVVAFCICLLAGLASAAGSTVPTTFYLRFTAGLIAAPCCIYILFYPQEKNAAARTMQILLALYVLGGCLFFYQNSYKSYYRSAPLEQQTAYSKHSSFLQNVAIEQDKALLIDNFIASLEQNGFDTSKDKVFVTPASSGLLAAAGVAGYGYTWATGVNEELVGYVFTLETVTPGMKVYILRGIELSDVEMKGFLSKLKPGSDFKSTKLGMIRNRREEQDLVYYLEGPYVGL